MANAEDIWEIMQMLSTLYPNFKLAELTADVYLKLLGDIPADELKTAVLKCCGESGRAFAPSVGEIRGAVESVRSRSANVPTPEQAWEEVRCAFAEVGSYRTPAFSHPLIDRVVKTMGWRDLCMSENGMADRIHFLKIYGEYARRAAEDDMMLPQVRGYIEKNGGRLPAPSSLRLLADKLRK